MRYHTQLFAIWAFHMTWPVASLGPVLFHGTSVVIKPSSESLSPANSSLIAANFFCYMADEGYFSFGWWVPASLDGKNSNYEPNSTSFHWYEFAHRQSCDTGAGTCLYKTQNVGIRVPERARPLPLPDRAVEYVIKPLDLGNDHYGQIAVSYIDDGGVSVYGIGTRQLLHEDTRTLGGCKQALDTLKSVYREYKPALSFELYDICGVPVGTEDHIDHQTIL